MVVFLANTKLGKEVPQFINAASTAAQSVPVGALEDAGEVTLADGVDDANGIANDINALENVAGCLRSKGKHC